MTNDDAGKGLDHVWQGLGGAQAANDEAEPVLQDLRTIMHMAGESYRGEQRLDVSNEVADTVRFAQASILWRERLTPDSDVTFHLNHEYVPTVSGRVLWIASDFLCLVNDRYEYLVNLDGIVMAAGLSSVVRAVTSSAATDHMDSIWLGGVCEDQLQASWYVAARHVVVGRCTRLGLDAIDVYADSLEVSLMRTHLVAVRISVRH